MWEVGSGIYSLALFWLHAGHNGRNQNASGSDLACLLGMNRCFLIGSERTGHTFLADPAFAETTDKQTGITSPITELGCVDGGVLQSQCPCVSGVCLADIVLSAQPF